MFLSGLVWNIRQPDITFHDTFVKILIEKVKIACKGTGCGYILLLLQKYVKLFN